MASTRQSFRLTWAQALRLVLVVSLYRRTQGKPPLTYTDSGRVSSYACDAGAGFLS